MNITASFSIIDIFPQYVGPCHHSMMRLWIVDGGESLQIWRVAANILNKQLWRANKESSYSFGGWARGYQLITQNQQFTNLHRTLDFEEFFGT
jgi:hypothetical protein